MDTLLIGDHIPHNLVFHIDPLPKPPTAIELTVDPEKALAENAIWWFLMNPSWTIKDRKNLLSQFTRYGWNMFIWKYYRVGRCYLGGYKALSACLKLKAVR